MATDYTDNVDVPAWFQLDDYAALRATLYESVHGFAAERLIVEADGRRTAVTTPDEIDALFGAGIAFTSLVFDVSGSMGKTRITIHHVSSARGVLAGGRVHLESDLRAFVQGPKIDLERAIARRVRRRKRTAGWRRIRMALGSYGRSVSIAIVGGVGTAGVLAIVAWLPIAAAGGVIAGALLGWFAR